MVVTDLAEILQNHPVFKGTFWGGSVEGAQKFVLNSIQRDSHSHMFTGSGIDVYGGSKVIGMMRPITGIPARAVPYVNSDGKFIGYQELECVADVQFMKAYARGGNTKSPFDMHEGVRFTGLAINKNSLGVADNSLHVRSFDYIGAIYEEGDKLSAAGMWRARDLLSSLTGGWYFALNPDES